MLTQELCLLMSRMFENIWMFLVWCARHQDVIDYMNHFEYKMLYQHVPIISCYTPTVLLMYVYDCKQKLYSTYLLLHCTNEKNIMGQIIPQKTDVP